MCRFVIVCYVVRKNDVNEDERLSIFTLLMLFFHFPLVMI